jgi:AraC family transcriptional regulator, transcriptional activator of pobA
LASQAIAMTLPFFHLYGDPPDEQAFDFIHIETISSRSSIHDWTIGVHRHMNLHQILVINSGGGEMCFEVSTASFAAQAAILVPAGVAHGFWFQPSTEGWVLTFTEDVTRMFGDRSNEAIARLYALATEPIVPMPEQRQVMRLSSLCAALQEEGLLSREGARIAMHGYLSLIAIEVTRMAAAREPCGMTARRAADPIVDRLRELVEKNYRKQRLLDFYAAKLAMTPDRLNNHVKRAMGVTAGHLIRQRVLTEAKRLLVFSNQPIHEIAYHLAFADPSHFVRSFRKYTGTTPQAFRAREGRLN